MTRKFKMVGVLMAVVAMFAVTASSASATFTSANYPATASGTSTADVFDAFGSTVKCTENSFTVEETDGTPIDGAREQVTVTPTYKKCTAFGLPATVNVTSCDFRFTSSIATPSALTADVLCATPGDAIDITVFSSSAHTTALCHVTVPQQFGKTGATATNTGGHVLVNGEVKGLKALQVRNSAFCPAGTETTTAIYTIQAAGITLKGSNGNISVD